jgi:hypothetical protein
MNRGFTVNTIYTVKHSLVILWTAVSEKCSSAYIFGYSTIFVYHRPDKYIETSEHGLVIIAVNEADSGRYDCWMGGSLLCSYNITVDAHRCAPPGKSHDYQKVYSDWCHEFEKYKMAMKTWERKQAVSIDLNSCIWSTLLCT